MSAPAAQPASTSKSRGMLKVGLLGFVGLGGGVVGTYANAIVDRVAKPAKPVANFSVTADGLSISCQNHAAGESGWWDLGDGSPLVPFAADQAVAYTYPKPGNYAVKLTVRNFLGEENQRSVPVEVAAGPKDAPTPLITNFSVTPVGSSAVAPATFRVAAEVANADHCVWDFGDGRVEVADGGRIDRMVTFEKAGGFPVQLYAHAGKNAVKQAAAVTVEAAPVGTITAVLKVTDTGNRVVRLPRTDTVTAPAPTGKNPPPNFTKVLAARPGFTVAEAALAGTNTPGAKNLKVAVAADRRSVNVTGEWTGKADAIVPVKMIEERTNAIAPAVTMVTGTLGTTGRCDLPLPPAVPGLAREFQVEIRQTGKNGQSAVVARGPADGKGALTFPWAAPSGAYSFGATREGDRVVVTGTAR